MNSTHRVKRTIDEFRWKPIKITRFGVPVVEFQSSEKEFRCIREENRSQYISLGHLRTSARFHEVYVHAFFEAI